MARLVITLLVYGLLLGDLGTTAASCQETARINGSPVQLPVYVVDFSQVALSGNVAQEIGDLGGFTSGLIQLRLLEISSVTAHRVQVAPLCEPSPQRRVDSSQTQGQQAPIPAEPVGDFYVVHGSIETHLPEIALNYYVDKCENHKIVKLFQDTQPFTLDHALEDITSSAHAIAFKIEQAIPPTQVAVEPFKTNLAQRDQQAIVSAARDDVIRALAQSADYKVTSESDYVIGAHIVFTKNSLLSRARANAPFNLRADLHIYAHSRDYPVKSVNGSSDQLKNFYADVDAAILRDFPQVLLAEHLQLPDVANKMEADALLYQANQLLGQCGDTERDCAVAQDAAQLLSAAALREPQAWKVFVTLGQAQIRAGKNVDAISSLVTANKLIAEDNRSGGHISNSDRVDALKLLGDSYRNVGEYPLAEQTYEAALRVDPSLLSLYRAKALALQFDNKRVQALDTILSGLRLSSQADTAQPLHQTAGDVIHALQAGEFDAAVTSVDTAFLAGAPVANEYALVECASWQDIWNTQWTPATRAKAREAFKKARDRHPNDPIALVTLYGDSATAELVDGDLKRQLEFITQAEAQRPEEVPIYLRAWIGRIRANAELLNGDYEKASDSADASYHLQQSDDALDIMANATWLSAWCREWKWRLVSGEKGPEKCKLGPLRDSTEDPTGSASLTESQKHELAELYQDAADRAASFIGKRYQAGYTVLMRANHSLNKDESTKSDFTRLVQQDPKDQVASLVVQNVCSQYLFDFDCSYSAALQMAVLISSDGTSPSASDFLNIAEAAILKGDYQKADKWLTSAGQRQLGPEDAAVLPIYQLWIAIRLGRTEEMKTDFARWKLATIRFREDKEDLNWDFRGAKSALDRSKREIGEANAELLASMMNALRDSDLPISSWPEGQPTR